MTEVVSIERDGPDSARAALERVIGAGGIVVFPADGIYGIACDPLRRVALERVYELKRRREGKPSAILYFSPLAMRELVASLGPRTRDAIGSLLPGPVTLVVANPERRYPLACGDDPERLGVRLIGGPLAGATCPLLQTSANLSGEPPAARFEDIDSEVLAGAELAIDGGELGGSPSTVIDVAEIEAGGSWSILRDGALSPSEVARRLGPGRGR